MKIKPLFQHSGVLCLALMLTACDQTSPQAEQPAPYVSTIQLAPSPLDITEVLPGRVEAIRTAEIRPQINGIVQKRLFEQGGEVRVGQPLFQINPAPFITDRDMAAAAVQRAEAVLTRTKIQTERLAPLLEADAISRQEYDDAVTQRAQAAADIANARAMLARKQLELKFATVEAPISGRIDQAMVTEGALVSSADSRPMARIQQIDTVYVDVRRPAASLEALQEALGQQDSASGLGLPIAILRSNDEAYETHGKILFSGINVDSSTGDVLLRIQVGNPKRQLLPGMFVRARIPLAQYAEALSVPQQAVIRTGGKTHVWTIDAQNVAHLTPVELGELVNQHYRIRSGLIKGQRIAVEGMERLTDGAPVTPREQPLTTR